jgi:hypothetical protein
MSRPLIVDLFAEDRAHEEFLRAVICRLAREENKTVKIRLRSARGGHGKALTELRIYQKALLSGDISFSPFPDLLFVAIDANCSSFNAARQSIEAAIDIEFMNRVVIACPDPHIERWYLADKASFAKVVGKEPRIAKKKCERDYYKSALANAVISAGYPPTLGGIEFAEEIVVTMDLYVAGKTDRSFKYFLDDARRMLKVVQ